MTLIPCLDEHRLSLLASAQLSSLDRTQAEHHLRTCEDCRQALAALVELEVPDESRPVTAADGGRPAALLPLGSLVGRYELRARLGAGGMGVVYAAWDRELERTVALKALWARDEPPERSAARLRLEAKALARVQHPNVLTVFEVGTVGAQLFMTMELVEGGTLATWLRERRRPWREVLRVLLQAGRGLAAAHAVGLVHADFKPSNVLVDREGTPRVADFGLAVDSSSGGATTSSGLAGTPAYMAPEQLDAQPVTAAADQYSFCMVLFEALGGPRAGREGAQQPRGERARFRGPGWLERALARGLSVDPAQRYPSMDALLTALDDGARLRRRRALALAGLAVLCVAGGSLGHRWLTRPAAACSPGVNAWEGIWSAPLAGDVRTGLGAWAEPWASASAEATVAALDAYTQQWGATQASLCEATANQLPAEDPRWRCLARRRLEVRELVALLGHPDAQVAENALRATQALRAPHDCLVSATPPQEPALPEPAVRALAQAQLELGFGRPEEARRAAKRAAEGAAAVGARRARAEALVLTARAEVELGDLVAASATLDDALELSLGSADLEGVAGALLARVPLEGKLAHPGEARRADRLAGAALSVLERPDADALVSRALNAARLDYDASKPEAAAAGYTRALDLLAERAAAPVALRVEALAGHANALALGGQFEAARVERERALTLVERQLGAFHPLRARLLLSLGMGLAEQGLPAEGLARLEEAAGVAARVSSLESSLGAQLWRGRAWALLNQGRLDQAEDALRRSQGATLHPLPDDHPTPTDVQFLFGCIEWERRRDEPAFSRLVAILEQERRARPGELLWPSFSYDVIADALELGHVAYARDLLAALVVATRDADPLMRALTRFAQGQVAAASGQLAEAEGHFEHTVAEYERMGLNRGLLGALVAHQRGLLEARLGHPERARALLQTAVEVRQAQGDQLGLARTQAELRRLGPR